MKKRVGQVRQRVEEIITRRVLKLLYGVTTWLEQFRAEHDYPLVQLPPHDDDERYGWHVR